MKKLPDFSLEIPYWKKDFLILGIDEVGRGAFAGPLVLAGVVFDKLKVQNSKFKIEEIGINDSKKLSPKKRQKLSEIIKKECLFHEIIFMDVSLINTFGIGEATHIAACKIVNSIKEKHIDRDVFLLMDGFLIHDDSGQNLNQQKAIIRGDCLSISIAAASIIAKVARDEYMINLSLKYPQYGFDHNVGYGTREHREAILQFGATEIHRKDFIRKTLKIV